MNARVLGLTVSLLLNVALVLGLVRRATPPTDIPATPPSGAIADSESATPASAAAERSETESWRALSAGSLAEVAERLDAEGYPPHLRRIIIKELVAQKFADRHRAIADLIRARPWWSPMFASGESAKIIAARQQLEREENDAVDAVLGPDPGTSPYVQKSRSYRYGDLPFATLTELDRINADYGELKNEIHHAAQGIMLPADRERLLYLEQQNRADIAKLLTPDQLFEYDLRSNQTSWWLRQILDSMNPSEAEFRAIFKVQSAMVAPFAGGNYELMSPEVAKAWTSLEPQLKEQIKAVLTPERFAEYEMKTAPEYRATEAVVKRLELPPEATAQIVTVQNDIAKRAAALRANPALSPADRAIQLGVLADEAIARLTPTLGDAGLPAYKQSAGNWLSGLRPSPIVASPKG